MEDRLRLWDDYSLVGECGDSGVENAFYTLGSDIDEVLAINNGSANYAYSDHLGSVTAILDSTGNNVSNRSYDAFGNVTSTSGDYQSSIGYTGREVDGTGLVYLRNRYYEPGVGRFTREDPIKYGQNWYGYCNNNPLSLLDPFGLAYNANNGTYPSSSNVGQRTAQEGDSLTGHVGPYSYPAQGNIGPDAMFPEGFVGRRSINVGPTSITRSNTYAGKLSHGNGYFNYGVDTYKKKICENKYLNVNLTVPIVPGINITGGVDLTDAGKAHPYGGVAGGSPGAGVTWGDGFTNGLGIQGEGSLFGVAGVLGHDNNGGYTEKGFALPGFDISLTYTW